MTWLPYVFDRLDTEYADRARSLNFKLKPSDYFRRQGYVTYQQDQYLDPIIPLIGEDNIIWGADYPHPDCIWPDSQRVLDKNLAADLTERAPQNHQRERDPPLPPRLNTLPRPVRSSRMGREGAGSPPVLEFPPARGWVEGETLANCASSQYSKDVPVTAKPSKSGSASPDNMVIAQFGDRTLKGGRGHAVTIDHTRREEGADAPRQFGNVRVSDGPIGGRPDARVRPFPHIATATAVARRWGTGRTGHSRHRSPDGSHRRRRGACHKGRTPGPCLAWHFCRRD